MHSDSEAVSQIIALCIWTSDALHSKATGAFFGKLIALDVPLPYCSVCMTHVEHAFLHLNENSVGFEMRERIFQMCVL